jgi:hypothetical protein
VDDLTVLHLAAQDGRILASHDISTMPEAFAQYRQGGQSPGVLLVPQLWPLAEAIEQLMMIWELSEANEWQAYQLWKKRSCPIGSGQEESVPARRHLKDRTCSTPTGGVS